MSLKLFLLLVAVVVAMSMSTTSAAPSRKSRDLDKFNCQKNMLNQLDNYLKEIQIFNGKHKFPETITQLREGCKINRHITGLIDKLANKCMTGFVKNILQVTLYSIRKSQKSLCRAKPTKEMESFVGAGKCVNSGRNLFRKCLRTTANNILASKNADISKKLPIICCEIVRAKQCLMDEAKKVPQCTESSIDVLQTRFNSVSLNGINIACGDYNDETDRCSKVEVPKGNFLAKIDQDRSLAITLLDFANSFPEEELLHANGR